MLAESARLRPDDTSSVTRCDAFKRSFDSESLSSVCTRVGERKHKRSQQSATRERCNNAIARAISPPTDGADSKSNSSAGRLHAHDQHNKDRALAHVNSNITHIITTHVTHRALVCREMGAGTSSSVAEGTGDAAARDCDHVHVIART
jgi:hypothetical protein